MTLTLLPTEVLRADPVLVTLGRRFDADALEACRRAANTEARLRGEALVAAWRARQSQSTPPPPPAHQEPQA